MLPVITKQRRERSERAIIDDFFGMNSFIESSLLDFNRGFLSEHNFPLVPCTSVIENKKNSQMRYAVSRSGKVSLKVEIKNDGLNVNVEKKVRKRRK